METERELFRRRRERVLQALGSGAAMVLAAAPEVRVGRDLDLRYLPDAELWYLTGCPEPEAVAVLRSGVDEPFTLFVRDRDPDRELWTGPRAGVDDAAERYGADRALPVDELTRALPRMLGDVDRVYFRIGGGPAEVERLVLDAFGRGRLTRQRSGRGPVELADPGLLLDDMRIIKEPAEIDAIREAVRVTVDGFRHGLARVRPGAGEWQVEAAVDGAFREAGAHGPAFATIAASGPNATVLHHISNDRRMQDGELLLLDAGARHHAYNADLTRTVPVDGSFQGPARDIYAAVLAAQRAAIEAVRPGGTTDDVHQAAIRVLVRAMVELGLLEGDPESLVEHEDAWKRWYPHKTSHWLGLDVHDVGTYTLRGQPRSLEPGMVLTIEPGLYIPTTADDAPRPLRGIGIRVEDDLLVTPTGHENLSAALPVEPDAVAALVAE